MGEYYHFEKEDVTMLKRSYNIVTYLQETGHVLHRRGNRYLCLCPNPAHNDRNEGSFYVNSQGSRCKCYSCGLEGTVIDLIMQIEGVTFHEALESIAGKLGILNEFSSNRNDVRKKIKARKSLKLLSASERELIGLSGGIGRNKNYIPIGFSEWKLEGMNCIPSPGGQAGYTIVSDDDGIDPLFTLAKEEKEVYFELVRNKCEETIWKLSRTERTVKDPSSWMMIVLPYFSGGPSDIKKGIKSLKKDVLRIYREYGGKLSEEEICHRFEKKEESVA